MDTNKKHLVLHFDVNKTLVMMDPASGKGSVEEMLNDLLTEIAYGTVDDAGEWRAATDELGTTNAPPEGHGSDLVNYYDFLVKKHGTDKPLRDRLRARFTAPGEPGERFRPQHETFLEAMRTAEWQEAAAAAADGDGNSESSSLDAMTTMQYHYILPSFLRLLQHLKRTGQSFTLVFRTFGLDLPHLVKHFDEFCEGKHPMFLGFVMDGSDGQPDYRVGDRPEKHGAFFRHGREKHETHQAVGLWDQVPNPPKLEDWQGGNTKTLDVFQDDPRVLRVLSGFDAIHAHIHGAGRCTLALRDYFPWWRANADAAFAGKLFTLDLGDASTHAVFFDDNIHFNGSQPEWMNIVDLRDKESGAPLPHRDHMGWHLVKVEPAEAIRDSNYYVRALAAALSAKSGVGQEQPKQA